MEASSCEIDGHADAEIKAFLSHFEGKNVTRSLEQNHAFHAGVRDCARQWNDLGYTPKLTEESMKEMLLLAFGNKRLIEGQAGLPNTVIAMRSHKYKHTPEDLTEPERRRGDIAMSDLMGEIEAWAARELNLELWVEEEAA